MLQPGGNPGMVLRQIACLPDEVRHLRGKVHGMLAGAGADFND
jgi:hypothetical protein